MVICRFGRLTGTPNSYRPTTFNLARHFSKWKICKALSDATVSEMRLSFTCTSSVSSQFIHEDVTSRTLGKTRVRKQRNLPEEHCKPPVSFSAKCKSLSSCPSGGITNSGKLRYDLRNTSCVFRPTISQTYENPLLTSFRACVFDKYGETFRSFLNEKGLFDNSAIQIRNFHQLLSLSWQPYACISRTRAYQYTATQSGHLPLERVSSGPAAVRCKSTTTTRDKLRARIRSKLPDLKEEELEEQFVRGSGPGGQATNKTSNCVVLKHIPTGLVVKCHQTRSQSENQKIARLLMKERLDQHLHADQSAISQYQQTMNKKREEKKRKTRLKLEKLKALRSSVDDEEESSSKENQDVTDKDL